MSICAYGDDAVIELFEHHLVITRRRPGFIVDGPSAEQFIPFSSIKSLQFIRPGLIVHGRIVLTLSGGSISKADECAVSFPKSQVRPFEDVLRMIRQAIATPSIERLAMEAAQNRGRIEPSQPSASESRQEIVASPTHAGSPGPEQRYNSSYGDGDRVFVRRDEQSSTPINATLGGRWNDMPLLGKSALVGAAIVALITMWSREQGGALTLVPTPTGGAAEVAADTTAEENDTTLSDAAEFLEDTGKDLRIAKALKPFVPGRCHMGECGGYQITRRILLRKGIDGFGNATALVRLETVGGVAPMVESSAGTYRWNSSKDITFALCDNEHPAVFQRGTDDDGIPYEQSTALDLINIPDRFYDVAILWTIACLGHLRILPGTVQFNKELSIKPIQDGEMSWTYSTPQAMWNGKHE